MKNVSMTVLRYIVKAIYPLVKAKRYLFERIKARFSKTSMSTGARAASRVITKASKEKIHGSEQAYRARRSEGAPNREAEKATRYRQKKRPFWKDKRVIAAVCAFIVITTAVLAILIPGDGKNVYAADIGTGDNNTADQKSGPSASNTGFEYAYQNNNELSGTVSGGINGTAENTQTPALSSVPSSPISTPIPTTEPDIQDLVPGCTDSRIVDIQKRLMNLGYMEPDEPGDYYGWGTEYSLQLFQRKHNLQVDGIAGKDTLSKLFADDAKPYSVKLGDRGTDVESVQERLKDLKYLKSSASGYFGTDTEKAVKLFQKRNGLSDDGSVGEMTREALYSEDAKPAPEPAKPKPSSKPKPSGKTTPKPTEDTGGSGPPVGDPDNASVEELIKVAKSLLGSKYSRGGKGPTKFDCSGFVYYCLNKSGRKIGYMTSTAWKNKCSLPKITKMSDMKPGDIIVFKTHHVGIYIGNGQMIDASSGNGKVVQRSCTTNYWKKDFACARRVF